MYGFSKTRAGARWTVALSKTAAGSCLAGGMLLLSTAPAQAAAGCPELKGAAAQMFDQDKLCKNVTSELGNSLLTGKPTA